MAALALLACRGQGERRASADSAAARPASAVSQRGPAEAPALGQGAAAPVAVPAEPKAVCTSVATFWRRYDSTDVRLVDSVVAPWASDTTVSACLVFAYKEHSLLRNAKATADTAGERLGTALALVRSSGSGWVPLYKMSADGPDGSDLAYQKGRVRCLVEQSWDGGDDSDTTYVPADWFRERTTCWLMPSVLTVSDTSR